MSIGLLSMPGFELVPFSPDNADGTKAAATTRTITQETELPDLKAFIPRLLPGYYSSIRVLENLVSLEWTRYNRDKR